MFEVTVGIALVAIIILLIAINVNQLSYVETRQAVQHGTQSALDESRKSTCDGEPTMPRPSYVPADADLMAFYRGASAADKPALVPLAAGQQRAFMVVGTVPDTKTAEMWNSKLYDVQDDAKAAMQFVPLTYEPTIAQVIIG